jgi:hypothetical protein
MTTLNMKKILGFALLSIAISTSCKKAFEQPEDYSSVAVIHASPVAATNPSDTLNVFVGDKMYTSTGVTYLNTSTYLPVRSGTHSFNIRRKKDATSDLYVNSFSSTLVRGGIYSYFVYDTTTTASGQAKVLKLKDDLTLPATTNSNVRVLNLAPNTTPFDFVLVRTSVTPNDSVTFSNKAYIGANPDETALAAFKSVPKGVYTVKLKPTGTQTVTLSATVDMSRGADITQGGIFTIYAGGTAKGRVLTIRSIKHY